MEDNYLVIPIDIYDTDVLVFFGDFESFLSVLKEKLEDIDYIKAKEIIGVVDRITTGRTCLLESGQVTVWLPSIPESSKERGGMQHELFHATSFIMEKIGVSHVSESDEAYAYLIGYISTKVDEFLTKTSSDDAQSPLSKGDCQCTSEIQNDQSSHYDLK
ncbi:MAG: hypothetical protein ACI4TK_11465 [Agathobacter sp.]